MPTSATTPDLQEWIQSQIEEVKQHFGEDVVKIRYSFGTNWMGLPGIYFRILLPDAVANNRQRLADVTERVMRELFNKWNLVESDRAPYFNFRSQSEQAELQDPEWD